VVIHIKYYRITMSLYTLHGLWNANTFVNFWISNQLFWRQLYIQVEGGGDNLVKVYIFHMYCIVWISSRDIGMYCTHWVLAPTNVCNLDMHFSRDLGVYHLIFRSDISNAQANFFNFDKSIYHSLWYLE